jgi:DNA-binding HxlR family transcriptional regulator
MARKSYRQHCGVARALDRVGERWTLLITRNLLLGPRRYSDLLAELPGITTNLLAKRLRELEELAIVAKEVLAPPIGVTVYRLTPVGRALEPVVMELGRWGFRFMGRPSPRDTFNLGWALLSLKRRYRGGLTCSVELCVNERRYGLAFSSDCLAVEERALERPDLVLSGEVEAVRALFFGARSSADLEAAGELEVAGPRALFRELERAFDPPVLAPQSGTSKKTRDQPSETTRRKLSNKKSSVSSKRSV